MDTVSPERRSYIMSRVPQRNTRPEKKVRSILHKLGYRFRLHRKSLPGTPDVVLPKFRTAIFIHSCFFHGHDSCRKARLPTSNIEYWQQKIAENKGRDRKVEEQLRALGWTPVVVWQCETGNFAYVTNKLKASLCSSNVAMSQEGLRLAL